MWLVQIPCTCAPSGPTIRKYTFCPSSAETSRQTSVCGNGLVGRGEGAGRLDLVALVLEVPEDGLAADRAVADPRLERLEHAALLEVDGQLLVGRGALAEHLRVGVERCFPRASRRASARPPGTPSASA